QPLHRHRPFKKALALLIELAEAAYLSRRHLRVREYALASKAFVLTAARREHSRAKEGRPFARRRAMLRHLLESHGRYVYVYVYPIHQRAGDAADVALYLQWRAAALARRIVEITTWAELRCHFAMSGYRPKNPSLRRIPPTS